MMVENNAVATHLSNVLLVAGHVGGDHSPGHEKYGGEHHKSQALMMRSHDVPMSGGVERRRVELGEGRTVASESSHTNELEPLWSGAFVGKGLLRGRHKVRIGIIEHRRGDTLM